MPRLSNLFALLVFVVILSAGFKTVFAQDSGSDHDESAGEVSAEAEYTGKTETQMDTDETSEDGGSGTAQKAPEKQKARDHQLELTMDSKETEAEGLPDIPETNPKDERTRSGNLDAYYGKSNWCSDKGKNKHDVSETGSVSVLR
jgi:hypothetical protein